MGTPAARYRSTCERVVTNMTSTARPNVTASGSGWLARSKYQKAERRPRVNDLTTGSPSRIAWRVRMSASGANASTARRTSGAASPFR